MINDVQHVLAYTSRQTTPLPLQTAWMQLRPFPYSGLTSLKITQIVHALFMFNTQAHYIAIVMYVYTCVVRYDSDCVQAQCHMQIHLLHKQSMYIALLLHTITQSVLCCHSYNQLPVGKTVHVYREHVKLNTLYTYM